MITYFVDTQLYYGNKTATNLVGSCLEGYENLFFSHGNTTEEHDSLLPSAMSCFFPYTTTYFVAKDRKSTSLHTKAF